MMSSVVTFFGAAGCDIALDVPLCVTSYCWLILGNAWLALLHVLLCASLQVMNSQYAEAAMAHLTPGVEGSIVMSQNDEVQGTHLH